MVGRKTADRGGPDFPPGLIMTVPLAAIDAAVSALPPAWAMFQSVAAGAVVGAAERWWYGQVEVRTGLLFAVAGMLTAPLGSWLGDQIPPPTGVCPRRCKMFLSDWNPAFSTMALATR